jgi:hypothetical protein
MGLTEIGWGDMDWSDLAEDRGQCRADEGECQLHYSRGMTDG